MKQRKSLGFAWTFPYLYPSPKPNYMAKEAKKTSADIHSDLEKKYGKGSVVQMDDNTPTPPKDVISTGSLSLDHATGVGGIPMGGMTEIYGPESSGKTTIATHIMKNTQVDKGRKVLMLDIEHAFDFKYAQKIGLRKEKLTYSQPKFGEMSFDIAKELIKTGDYGCCVLDSVAGNIPKEQHDGETGQTRMARLAALMSLELPKLTPIISDANCAMIFLNQIRMNIGGYGNPEKPAGGDSLKFYALMRMVVRKTAEKESDRNKTTVEVIKNKCADPFGKAEFYIDWGLGINRTNEVLDYAVGFEMIEKGGSWYTFEGGHKFQGEMAALKFLNDNPEMLVAYTATVQQKLKELREKEN